MNDYCGIKSNYKSIKVIEIMMYKYHNSWEFPLIYLDAFLHINNDLGGKYTLGLMRFVIMSTVEIFLFYMRLLFVVDISFLSFVTVTK